MRFRDSNCANAAEGFYVDVKALQTHTALSTVLALFYQAIGIKQKKRRVAAFLYLISPFPLTLIRFERLQFESSHHILRRKEPEQLIQGSD